MTGDSLTIHCSLLANRISAQLDGLLDTGAQGPNFIDTTVAYDIAKRLRIRPKPLPGAAIRSKGFNGSEGRPITHVLIVHLYIDKRKQRNIPFFITDLGKHSIIFGFEWMSLSNVLIDPRGRRLIWPPESPPSTDPKDVHFLLDLKHFAPRTDEAYFNEIELR